MPCTIRGLSLFLPYFGLFVAYRKDLDLAGVVKLSIYLSEKLVGCCLEKFNRLTLGFQELLPKLFRPMRSPQHAFTTILI